MFRIEDLYKSVSLTNAVLQKLPMERFNFPNSPWYVLRLDKIDEVISGNKWFKLKHHLKQAMEKGFTGIATFGGAYSNHLVATAAACQRLQIPSLGVIRGERPAKPSDSILQMEAMGMQLQFVSRNDYSSKQDLQDHFSRIFPGFYWVPEGGAGVQGEKGASEILDLLPKNDFNRIFCAVGTGTTMAGLLQASLPNQMICGIPVLKWSDDDMDQLPFAASSYKKNFLLFKDYHEGGYAKKTPELLSFMNVFFDETGIPTDFVYTAKLFRAALDLLKKGTINPQEKILLIHSGGLQGNRSLPKNSLAFQ